MKKIKFQIITSQLSVVLLMFVTMLSSCDDKNSERVLVQIDTKTDSLQNIIAQKDNEINDMMGTLNDIQMVFQQINQAEDRVTLSQEGEMADRKALLKESVEFIQEKMVQNRQLISKLQQQIRESTYNSEQLKRTVNTLLTQLADKDAQLKMLQAQLDEKDLKIKELNATVTETQENLNVAREESSQKSQTIDKQDKQLHTAYFVFGTKKELKEQKILEGSKLMTENFNKEYFTKIDIRVDKEIKLYSKSVKILTYHPYNSYTLQPDARKQYVLRITNPNEFWSASKYLVIQVK
ncbi:MAG: hypothetical protein Q4A15_02590 [Prevotellaceae bacterium]|nr:hypothetical protein [Prevotellaceae bacterium]